MKLKRLLLAVLTGLICSISVQSQTPFFSETFSDGLIPPGWSTSDDSNNNPDLKVLWQGCNTPSGCPPSTHDYFEQAFEGRSFETPTVYDGYLYAHSQASLLSEADDPHLSRLSSPAVNCLDKDTVVLQFYSHLAVYKSEAFSGAVVRVSTDSVNWDTFPVYPELEIGVNANQFTTNPTPILIDISSSAAHSETVYLQWQWTGKNDWSWSIDDVRIFDFHPHYFRAVWGQLPGQGDFSDGLNGWTVQNLQGTQGWDWTEQAWVGQAFTAPQEGFYLSSATPFNGAATLNADYYTTGGNLPPDPPIPYYVSELISPVIDLSATTQKLSLRFFQMARINNPAPGYAFVTGFSYSTNGGNDWSVPEDVNPSLVLNGEWKTEWRTLLLPEELIGEPQVRIKFTFSGNLYCWAIDDVVIYERERHNLELKDNFYAVAPSLWRPTGFQDSLHFLVDVENVGLDTQTHVIATVQVLEDVSNEAVFHDTLFLGTLAPEELQENLVFPKAWLPADSARLYRVAYRIEADSTDQHLDNNHIRWEYQVTDSILSKEFRPTGAFRPSFAASYTYGNCYYIPPETNAYACQFSFGVGNAGQLAGKTVDVLLYHWPNGDANQDFKANPAEYTLVASNQYVFQGDETNDIITLPMNFDGSLIPLEPDSYYFAVVRYESSGQVPCFLLASEAYDLQATFFLYNNLLEKPRYVTMLDLNNTGSFSLFGLGNSGFDQIPVARLHLCEQGSNTRMPLQTVLQIELHPNPATHTVLLDCALPEASKTDYTWSIFSAEGKLVWQKALTAHQNSIQKTVDVSQFPIGTYFVQLKGRNFIARKTLLVQR